ncbi:MAG: hypothetical protein M0D53_01385 [Flavobacterium sp. JAD_PAG50586_2]|nr:MAG: hypothetical protein M0D53_01385 [Flavobacterium sp. JAD_PAG50586_2]
MKKTITTFLLLAGLYATAQVKIGDNPTTISPSAVLEAESTTKGFLPPRMTKVQMNAIAVPAAGLIVYCTDCNPASLYTFDGSAWNVLGSASNPNASFTSGTLACTGTLAGSYVQYTAMNSSNTKTVTITCNTAGTVTGSTNTVNGVSFSVNTTLYSTGANTPVTLTATGTPLATGTFNYTATIAGQTCNFNVTYSAAATFACGTITHTLPNNLVNGTAYNTGSVSLPYTAGTGAAYPTTTVSNNGLTLTRVAGTYAAGGGNVVYNLNGTYTGTTGGSAVFTLPDGGCTVSAGAATFSGSPSCGTPAGNYISTVAMTGSNTVPITISASGQGAYSVTTNTANGVTFSGSGNITATGSQAITLTASGTPTTTGVFSYTVTIGGQSCSFTVIYKPVTTFAVGKINSSSSTLSVGTDVSWSSQVANNGVTVSGTGITLLAGKTYHLSTVLSVNGGGSAFYQFVNSSNVKLAGTTSGYGQASAQNPSTQSTMPAEGIYTVGASNETIKVRIIATAGSPYIYGDGNGIVESYIVAEEIPSTSTYGVGRISSSSSTLSAGTDVSWSSQVANNGVTISGTGITLLAGKTYHLSTVLSVNGGSSAFYQFVNSSNVKLAGTTSGYGQASAQNPSTQSTMPAEGIYTVGASNETIKVRIIATAGSPYIYGDGVGIVESHIVAEEIPSTSTYGVGKINSSSSTVSAGTDVSWNGQVASNGVTVSGTGITLLAGKTYHLSTVLSVNGGGLAFYQFVNSSNVKLAGTTSGYGQASAQNPNSQSTMPAEGIYTVGASNETIKVRIITTAGSPYIYGDGNGIVESYIVAEEIK